MAKNRDFLLCKEERKEKGFFKVIQGIDIYSENMRALPHDFVRNFSDNELSGTMKIRTKWGRSWEVKISKNPRFYFMEKSGWEKFVRENFLGEDEFLTFTHKGNMCFSVNIFNEDGREMVQPRQSTTFFASSSRIKTEQGEAGVSNGVRREEEVVSPEVNNHGRTRAESNGGRNHKRKLDFGKKKAEESQSCKKTKKVVSGRRESAGASELVS